MFMGERPTKALKIFYCYARIDKPMVDRLDKHLSALKQQGYLTSWYDHEISPGKEWEREIINRLKLSHIILLLVSPDFMDSKYCYGIEMKYALERHRAGSARVIPVLLRYVDWKSAPFSHLQMLPKDAKPVTGWRDRNKAFADIAEGIRKVVEELSPSMNQEEQKQEEEGARQIIEWALEGELLGILILAGALHEAEQSILHPFMSGQYTLMYPDEKGKLQPRTLATISPEPASTTTTLLATIAFSFLCGNKPSYFVTADDLLNIIEFIKCSPFYEPSDKWPFTKEQIRAAWQKVGEA